MGDLDRKELNQERLLLISLTIRPAVAQVLAALETSGLNPLIHSDVWRSPERQLELYAAGKSKLRWGFHNATEPDGSPGSLAADITDADSAWNVKPVFWYKLGREAISAGLHWGGFFGLTPDLKDALREHISKPIVAPSDNIKLGWDPAHVETSAVTVIEAKMGKR